MNSIAVNRDYKNKEGKPITDYFNLTVKRDKQALMIKEHVKKGYLVLVEGNIEPKKYVDAQGVTKYATDYLVNKFEFLHSPKEKQGQGVPF
jgi:single-strand DNA-binding protein